MNIPRQKEKRVPTPPPEVNPTPGWQTTLVVGVCVIIIFVLALMNLPCVIPDKDRSRNAAAMNARRQGACCPGRQAGK